MRGEVIEYAREALDFVDCIERLQTVEGLFAAVRRSFGNFGCTSFLFTGLRRNPGQPFEKSILLRHWPEEWFGIYIARNYYQNDPIAQTCRRVVDPFRWKDVPCDPLTNPIGAEIMRRAASFGMIDGFTVPIHGLTGFQAGVTLSGEALDMTPKGRAAIHLMAMAANNKATHLLAPPGHGNVQTLSLREREVMSWTAAGKSAWETGRILNISVETVNKHIAAALRKLDACNKTQAVVEALKRGEIHF